MIISVVSEIDEEISTYHDAKGKYALNKWLEEKNKKYNNSNTGNTLSSEDFKEIYGDSIKSKKQLYLDAEKWLNEQAQNHKSRGDDTSVWLRDQPKFPLLFVSKRILISFVFGLLPPWFIYWFIKFIVIDFVLKGFKE
jgi:hypothetical protein